jgi:predicted Zn-dependent protease
VAAHCNKLRTAAHQKVCIQHAKLEGLHLALWRAAVCEAVHDWAAVLQLLALNRSCCWLCTYSEMELTRQH